MRTTNPIHPAAPTSTAPQGVADPPGQRQRAGISAAPLPRFAALVDVENTVMVRASRVPAPQLPDLFAALDRHLAGMPVRAASGSHVIRACMPELATRGWGLTLVPQHPDAADTALIEAGRQLAAAGVTDLVVVSGDHAFTCLAPAARLHVIAHPGQLSTALRLAATTITHLPAPQTRTRATA